LQAAESDVRRNQRLIRLRDDVPAVVLEEMVPRALDRERLRGLFTEWGFKGMLAALGAPSEASAEQGVFL
jgi:hypothetical protein